MQFIQASKVPTAPTISKTNPWMGKVYTQPPWPMSEWKDSNHTRQQKKDPGLGQSLDSVMKQVSQRVVPDFTINPTILSAQTIWGALFTLFTHPQLYHTLLWDCLTH